ncbi:hypothetical protein VNI00_016126 [Paramarasmius palmivorus]|uniref:WD40 repeat-like protein n=1 Tax=Paramarasmius palmivorus TaxID=297713 RepID=A0AAW0BF07_9AGAR
MIGFKKLAELPTSDGPIFAITFSPDNLYLASGGNDERVRIWNIQEAACERTLAATHRVQEEQYGWGQVTSLAWVITDAGAQLLVVGTARGLVIVYRCVGNLQNTLKHVISAFSFNDPIECIAFKEDRFLFASYGGNIKLYKYDPVAERLRLMWKRDVTLPILATGVHFHGRNKLLVTWMEHNRLTTLNESDGSEASSSSTLLNGSIGHSILSASGDKLLTHNFTTGQFDVYTLPTAKLTAVLRVPRSQRLIKEGAFVDLEGRYAACGSDDGNVYVFDTDSGALLQKLPHNPGAAVTVQAIATSTDKGLLASADCDPGVVVLWSQLVTPEQTDTDIPQTEIEHGRGTAEHGNVTNRQWLILYAILLGVWWQKICWVFNQIKEVAMPAIALILRS